MPEWTEEQLRAIEARGENILLSAAAGSGKTTVLVERVLRLITEDQADVDKMLVVTFTRAAAADMRLKLFKALNARASAGDTRCREQLLKLDRASISTLHAFCADFLRTNFEAAGIDPSFHILDDALVRRLRAEALNEALEQAYAGFEVNTEEPSHYHPGEDLLTLDYGRGPKGVRTAVELLFNRLEERPEPEKWLKRVTACDEAMLELWQEEIKTSARRSIDSAILQLRQAIDVIGCPAHYETALANDIMGLTEMRALHDYDEIYRALSEYRLTTPKGRLAGTDPEAVETVKRLRDMAKRTLGSARILQLPLQMARSDAQALSEQLKTLAAIALKADGIFLQKKIEQSGLTYSDLEHRTLTAVQDPAVAELARGRYDYIFVDEYQDTSDLQEALIQAICRKNNRFMVGDVKQSIYRFRLAEPRLFLEKYDAYLKGKGGVLLPLTRNFRSRRGILDFVNLVFERAMAGGDSEISYDELARLNPGRKEIDESTAPDVDIRVIKLGVDESEAEGEDLETLKAAEAEALFIAKTIRSMMTENSGLRYRDFAILTRTKNPAFTAMMPLLLAAGIPAYADGTTGYYDSMEVHWAVNLLKLLLNRRQDAILIGILRSAPVGLSADQLSKIRIGYPDVPYCDAAMTYAREQTDEIALRLQAFYAYYDAWRVRRDVIPLGELLRQILNESGFYAYAGALPGGAQRQANLDLLVASAERFDRENSGALSRFLQYTEHLKARGDGDAAHILGENDDVVRLMTIHKSKGLEFKVVFGAQLSKKFRVEKTSAPLVTHRELGIGFHYIDPALRTKRTTLPQVAIIERQKREDAAEELRVLYVMMTRAMEKLILIGSVKPSENPQTRWLSLSDRPYAAGSHLDIIMAARMAAEMDNQPLCSTFEWVSASGLGREELTPEERGASLYQQVAGHIDSYRKPDFSGQLRWRYPAPDGAVNPMKLTASGLLRELEGPGIVPDMAERPKFMMTDARHLTGAERGTAYHRSMQLLDFKAMEDLSGQALNDSVMAQLDHFVHARLMMPVQREAVNPQILTRFLESPLGLRLRQSDHVKREWPFNVQLKIAEALTVSESERFNPNAPLLVQGTIDCCFIEDGQWVLMDYKTDRETDMAALADHYRNQLNLYAAALQIITGIPVKERVLCLIGQGKTLAI